MSTARLLLIAIAIALPSNALAQERALTITPVRAGVYLISSTLPGDPNILVVAGAESTLMIDGIWADATEELLALVATETPAPVTDVVLTHWHPDHSQGNAVLHERGITVWAHENAQNRMRAGNRIEVFDIDIPPYPADALADRTITEPGMIRVGREEVHLIPVGPAHTDGDILVHLPHANVIHMGDLYLGEIYPLVDVTSGGDVDGLIRALDQAAAAADDGTLVVTGHGRVATRAELIATREMLSDVWKRVREAVAAGSTIEEVQEMGIADEYEDRWNSGLLPTAAFIGAIYQAAVASMR